MQSIFHRITQRQSIPRLPTGGTTMGLIESCDCGCDTTSGPQTMFQTPVAPLPSDFVLSGEVTAYGSANNVESLRQGAGDAMANVWDFYSVEGQPDEMYPNGPVMGKGSFGTVRAAKQNETGTNVAIKSITKKNMNDAFKSQMRLEVEIMLGMDHPNVIGLLETHESDAELHLVMPQLDAGDFHSQFLQWVEQHQSAGGYTEVHAADVMKQVLEGVAHIHSRLVCHRDIKHANLCTKGHTIVIIDLGLACYCRDSDKLSEERGTKLFEAPEIIARKGYNKEVDCWACGVIAFSLLQGCMPFTYPQEHLPRKFLNKAISNSIMHDELPWLHECSPQAKEFLEGLLDRDRNKRLTAKKALKHPWIQNPPKHPVADKVVSGWTQLHQQSMLAQFVTKKLVEQMDSAEKKRLGRAYFELDGDGDKSLTFAEVCDALFPDGGDHNDQVRKIFSKIDLDGDGSVSYEEFVFASVQMEIQGTLKNQAKEIFEEWDTNRDGMVDLNELKKAMVQNEVSDADIEAMLGEADIDGDGKISFDEFCTLFTTEHAVYSSAATQDCMMRTLSTIVLPVIDSVIETPTALKGLDYSAQGIMSSGVELSGASQLSSVASDSGVANGAEAKAGMLTGTGESSLD